VFATLATGFSAEVDVAVSVFKTGCSFLPDKIIPG
jgi:hypothetical protein